MMVTAITIVFILLTLILSEKWAFGLTFVFQSIYFQNGSIDISSYGFLIILCRLIVSRKLDIPKVIEQYNTVKLFVLILVIHVLWSVSWGANAKEFIFANIRILVSVFTYCYFINEKINVKFWIFIVLLPFFLLITHNYLLANELHPYYETVKEFGRLSGRTITGEMLNSNQVAYTIFSLFVMFNLLIFHEKNIKIKFEKILISIMGTTLLIVSGSLGSRVVIISTLLLLLIFFLGTRVVLGLSIVFLIFFTITDYSSIEVPLIGEEANARLQEIGTEETSIESEMSRALILSSGLNILLDNFVLGVGTGRVLETMNTDRYLGHTMMMHNVFLDYAVQFGLVGIILSIWIVYLGIKIFKLKNNLGIIFLFSIILPNFGHNFFLISVTPFLMAMMEKYSKTFNTQITLSKTW